MRLRIRGQAEPGQALARVRILDEGAVALEGGQRLVHDALHERLLEHLQTGAHMRGS